MSLFGHQNTIYSKEQQRKTTLAELGGAGIGAGVGLLASKFGNIKYQQDALKRALEHSQDLNDSEANWRKMIDLSNGTLNINDLGEREQRRFKRLLNENAEQLNYFKENPHKIEPSLRDMKSGQVIPLFPEQADSSKMKLFLESLKPQKPVVLGGKVKPIFIEEERMMFPHALKNPALHSLPAFLGLAGMYGAGMMAKKHFDKENEGKQEVHDLNRLQEMLSALKTKESQSS